MSLKAKEENRLKYDEMLIVEWREKFTKKLSEQDEETMNGEEIPTKTQWTEWDGEKKNNLHKIVINRRDKKQNYSISKNVPLESEKAVELSSWGA